MKIAIIIIFIILSAYLYLFISLFKHITDMEDEEVLTRNWIRNLEERYVKFKNEHKALHEEMEKKEQLNEYRKNR